MLTIAACFWLTYPFRVDVEFHSLIEGDYRGITDYRDKTIYNFVEVIVHFILLIPGSSYKKMGNKQRIKGRFVFLSSFFLYLCSVEGYPKYSCMAETGIENCRREFDKLASESNTKMVFMHIKNNNVSGTDKEKNPLLELVWVNKTSLHYLSYPDEFHVLTFAILDKFIYELDISLMNDAITNFKEVLNSTYSQIISNGTNGLLCHRHFANQNLRNKSINIGFEIFVGNVIWFGYDYKCYDIKDNHKDELITYVSKYPPMMMVIAAVSVFSMLWFPILLNVIERENASTERNNLMDMIRSSLKNNDAETDFDKDNDSSETVSNSENYDRGDLPYGFKRFLVYFFHSEMHVTDKWKPLLACSYFLSDFRFFLFICTVFSFSFYFLDRSIHNNLPPDIKEYETLYMRSADMFNCFMSIIPLSLIMYFTLLISQKNYVYVFDPALILLSMKTDLTCLRKLPLGQFYHNKKGDSFMSRNVIERFTSIFIPRFWMTVISLSLSGTCELLCKRRWCCACLALLFIFAYILLLPINIIFQLLVALFPFLWYTFCVYISLSNIGFRCLHYCFKKRCCTGVENKTVLAIERGILKLVVFTLNLGFTTYAIFFVIFYENIFLKMCSHLARIMVYILLIVIPQLNSIKYRSVFLILAIISYTLSHLRIFYTLYQEILSKMFEIAGDRVFKIKVKQFDYVVANTFPVHIEFFYFFFRTTLTAAFLYISQTTYLLMDEFGSKEDWEMRSMLSFFLLLISPAVVGFCLIPTAEKKVASQSEQICRLMDGWDKTNTDQDKRAIVDHVVCNIVLDKNSSGTREDCKECLNVLCHLSRHCCCVCCIDRDSEINTFIIGSCYCDKEICDYSDNNEPKPNNSHEMELHRLVIRFSKENVHSNKVAPTDDMNSMDKPLPQTPNDMNTIGRPLPPIPTDRKATVRHFPQTPTDVNTTGRPRPQTPTELKPTGRPLPPTPTGFKPTGRHLPL